MFKKTLEGSILIIILSVVTFLFLSGSLLYYFRIPLKISIKSTPTPLPTSENLFPDTQPQSDNSLNLLLLGYGGAGHDGGGLTDSITLVNINPETKKMNIVSIPRDLWVGIPTDGENKTNNKINAAYAIGTDNLKFPNKKDEFRGELGGGNLAKYAVSVVTGFKADYFISVDFTSFSKIVDILGGISVDVPQAFDDYFYPVKGLENETCGFSAEQIVDFHQKYSGFELEKQFTCRYEHLHFDKGITTINGETALKFVRSRHSDVAGGDFARSLRQHAVLKAIGDKLISLNVLNKTSPIFSKLVASIRTDIDINAIKELLSPLGDITTYKFNHIYLTDQNVLVTSKSSSGAFILIPKDGDGNWNGVKSFINTSIK
jgi:LCP family protein required for cell wall assembly